MKKALLKGRDLFYQKILDSDIQPMSRVHQFVIRSVRILYAVAMDIMRGDLSLRAMSLVYTTLITLVPLLAISFSVLKGFGVHNQIEPFLLNLLAPLGDQGDDIAKRIIGFVDNIKVGVLGIVGLGFLVYSVIALMQKVEKAFNYIWRVERARSLAQRFSDYLSVLLVWPFFIFISAGLTTTVRQFDLSEYFQLYGAADVVFDIFGVLVPYIIMTIAFTFIFAFMPNTKVKIFPAFVGGLFTAFVWKFMSFFFSTLIAGSANYVAIYAAFAALIIFMIWVYLAWFVVLAGASISFYVQHPRHILIGYSEFRLSSRMKEKIALMIVYLVGRDFYSNKNTWDAVSLSNEINVPDTAVSEVIDILEECNILAKTADNKATYVPAVPFDKTTVETLIHCVRRYGEKALLSNSRIESPKIIDRVLEEINTAPVGKMKLSELWAEKPKKVKKAATKKPAAKKKPVKRKK